jgi:hypothetical protein
MTGGGNNIRDGIYKLLIEKVTLQELQGGDTFIAEMRVLESRSNGALDEAGKTITPNAQGSSVSLVCQIGKFESAAGNARKFMVNAAMGLGYTQEQVDEEMIARICSEANPLRGVALACETYRTTNKGRHNPENRGKIMTLPGWKPILGQSEEDLKKAIAYLDANASTVDSGAGQSVQQAVQPALQEAAEKPAASKPVGGILGGVLGKK